MKKRPASAILMVVLLFVLPTIGQKSVDDLINEGNDLSHNKAQYEKSLELFDEAINLEPNNGYAWSGKGYVYIYLGKYKEAMNCFNKCVELDPNNAWFWDCKAYVHDYLGEFEEAIKCYDRSLEIDPAYTTALENKAWTLFRQDKYEDSLHVFNIAEKIYSNSRSRWSSSWFGHGFALKAQGKNDEANDHFNLALESSNKEMNELPSLILYAWEGKGLAQYGLGQLDESIECLEKALEINPYFAECWYWKGLVHLDLNQNFEANSAFKRAKAIGLNWPIPDEDLSQSSVNWICQGKQLYNEGNYQGALNSFENALERDPSNSLALKCKGWTLQTMGRFEDAIESYENAINMDPKDYYAWINKGGALYDQGKYEEAIEYYDNAIKLDQSNPYSWNARGAATASLSNHEEALEYYEKAIKLDPNYCLALNNEANSLKALGRNADAQVALDKAKNLGKNGCKDYGGLPLVENSCEDTKDDPLTPKEEYIDGPLKVAKYKIDNRNIEMWIENPAPYFTYIPSTYNGKPNIILRGVGIDDISFDIKKTGPYGTLADTEQAIKNIEDVYQVYKTIKKVNFFVKVVQNPLNIVPNPPETLFEDTADSLSKSKDEIAMKLIKTSAPLITTADISLPGTFIKLAKDTTTLAKLTTDVDENAYYMFISWFLAAKDPMYEVIGVYYKDNYIWYNGEKKYNADIAGTIEGQNSLLKSELYGIDDLYWPRGWESYKSTYLPNHVEGFVLAPNMAIVIKSKLSQTTSPPATTMPRKLELEIQEYQSLGTIEVDPKRPTSEKLQNYLTVYLPVLAGRWIGDEKDIVETLSCIYNGNYIGSNFKPEFKPDATRQYEGTIFQKYQLIDERKLP